MRYINKTILLIIVMPFFMQACNNHKPPYGFGYKEKRAKIKLLYGNAIEMCKNNKIYHLYADVIDNVVEVPAGQRISISSFMLLYIGGNKYQTCKAELGFQPEEGNYYIFDITPFNNRCYPYIVKKNDQSATGIEKVDGIRKKECFESNTMY